MERKLKLESEAVEDLAQSYKYYENQKEGLGEEFAREVKNKITKIIRKPDSYSTFYKETRKAHIKNFLLIYCILLEIHIFPLLVFGISVETQRKCKGV